MRRAFAVPAMLLAIGSVAHGQAPASFAANSVAPSGADSSITVPAGTHVFAQLQRPLSTRTAKPGDSVYLQVTFPVTVANAVVIPAGTYVLATIDTVSRVGWIHRSLAFQLHVATMVFTNGYVATVREPAHAQPRDPAQLGPAERPAALMVASGVAPVAGLAIGAATGGKNGAWLGGEIGSAVGLVTFFVAAAHSGDYELGPGFPLELRSQGPIVLDAMRTADAARTPSTVQRHENQSCYTPGTPGTPDITIPGTPGTPPVGDMPGTPDTPPTFIPGTPGTPGYWHPCP